MKTRSTILTLLLMAGFTMFAQKQVEQQGYVRSIGRPDNKYGERLGGATIRVSGQHNDVRSNANGDFTITFDDATVGVTSYSLSRVRLAGYEVNEKEVIGRQYAVSAKVPQEIVMVSLAVKQAIEDSITARIDRRYKAEYAKLEREKEQLGEEYHARLQKLFDEYDKRDQLISEMVERYANTDYAKLDSTAAKINAYIETGELEKADSIIRAMDVAKMESEYKMVREDNDRLRAELQKGEKAQENLYQNLYTAYNGKYEIFAQQFMNDSAAFYLEKIVELDTTNVENLLRAGDYIREYLAEYDKVGELYEKSLGKALEQYEENNCIVAKIYTGLGLLYNDKADYNKALEYHLKSLKVFVTLYGEENINIAYSYGNIGTSYSVLGNYSEALKCFEKAQNIFISFGSTDDEYANLLSNIGLVYDEMCNYEKAMEYQQRSLDLCLAHGETNNAVATSYNCIGGLYYEMNDYIKALEYLHKALDIRLKIFKINHPDVVRCYENIGVVNAGVGNYEEAFECFEKALSAKLSLYGKYHDEVAVSYNNMGVLYLHTGNCQNAFECLKESLEIKRAVYGDNHPETAIAYKNMGEVYVDMCEYDMALDYFKNALEINLQIFGEKNGEVSDIYNELGLLYKRIGDKKNALKYLLKASDVNVNLYGINHTSVAANYNNIGMLYGKLKEYNKSLSYLTKAIEIDKSLLGEKHKDVAALYYSIGKVYDAMDNYDDALKYHKQALDIRLSVFENENLDVEQSYYHVGRLNYQMRDYKESLFYFKKDMAVCVSLYGDNHDYTTESYSNIYKTLCHLAATEPSYSDTISDFLSTKLFVAQFPVDSTSKSELQGELYLLQLDDWDMETVGNVFDLNKSLNGKKKNVVLYKDGIVLNRKLDKKTNFDIILKEVGKDEHDEVIGAWKKTVKKETKLPN